MNRYVSMIVAGVLVVYSGAMRAAETQSLAGTWRFKLDTGDTGIQDRWFAGALPDTVRLPGTLDENGVGTATTEKRSDRLTRLHEYTGPAWYQREVEVPEAWRGMRVALFLERCHWETSVWVDTQAYAPQDSLCAPHEYDLSDALTPGRHTLTIRVDNRMKHRVGDWAHSVTDETQTNWNGIVGRIELRAEPAIRIASVQVYPDVKAHSARVAVAIENRTDAPAKGHVAVIIGMASAKGEVSAGPHGRTVASLQVTFDESVPLWDEFSPILLDAKVSMRAHAGARHYEDTRDARFGMREIGHGEHGFTMNGRPTIMRGNLECCIFPLTGYPPTDTEAWLKRFRIAREYGLNHIRFHSWCPPEAAFDAADQLGMTMHIETPVWTELGTNEDLDRFVYAESERILATYGNHPSFCMLAVGNEPSGPKKDVFLEGIVAHWKQLDARRQYTTCAGWPELACSDYHVLHARNKGAIRLHGGPLGPTTDFDYGKCIEGCEAPVIAHELGQWCVYPDYDEIAKYTGVLRAYNLEAFRASLEAHHMLDQDKAFCRASGALQTLLYKADIEAVLRTRGAGGFQLLSLQDFPGQGSALCGFLDAHWDSKGGVTPEQFRMFCSETVPLLRFAKYTWTSSETFHAEAEIAHYGKAPIAGAISAWSLAYPDGHAVASGQWPSQDIPLGNGTKLGAIDVPLSNVTDPTKLVVSVLLQGTAAKNEWAIWVYPSAQRSESPSDILVARDFDGAVEKRLEQGGKVLLLPRYVAPSCRVQGAFESIFWNTRLFPGQRRQLGILCDPRHPALAGFPTDAHTDWQWWDLLDKSSLMNLDCLPSEFRPIVQAIDDWNTNRKLGAVFEAAVGRGKLFVCSLDLERDLDKRIAAAALRKSVLDYMESAAFAPEVALDANTIRPLFEHPSIEVVKVDSKANGYDGSNAADGDPATIWHTPWEGGVPDYPHEIQLRLRQPEKLAGVRILPRQDVANAFPAECEVYLSERGVAWGSPVAKAALERGPAWKEIRFAKRAKALYVRMVFLSGHDKERFVAIAEVEPLTR